MNILSIFSAHVIWAPKLKICVNLYRASNILNPVMFADDTNLFCSGKNIKTLFQTANIELKKK